MAGWGKTREGDDLSDDLLKTNVRIQTFVNCNWNSQTVADNDNMQE